MSEPPFKSLAIVGLGLIGGSVALAAKRRWPSCAIAGVDQQAIVDRARQGGAIDAGHTDVSALGAVDIVILAAPVSQNLALIGELGARLAGPAVITDVGGAKRQIVDRAGSLPRHLTFIGGHPLGGSEKAGFEAARSNLFDGRPWILTPPGDDQPDAVARLSAFVAALGATPSVMSADHHDRVMALVSHLPQLTASALMDVVGRAAGEAGLGLAGQGLIDTTRLASSPASVWKDICSSNADAIGPALDLLIQRLQELRAGLDRGAAIEALFDEAARWRSALMKDRD